MPFVPFELAKGNKEMEAFLASMKKAGQAPTEQALAGWQNGALLVAGIKAAGKNFTRESVVSSINKMTQLDRQRAPTQINWTNAYGTRPPATSRVTATCRWRTGNSSRSSRPPASSRSSASGSTPTRQP